MQLSRTRNIFAAFALVALSGFTACTTTGPLTAQQVDNNILLAQEANTSITQTVSILAANGVVTKADAQNALKVVDVAQEGIVIVNLLKVTDLAAADTRMKGILESLFGLQKYLNERATKANFKIIKGTP